ncbi:hypothetical protein C8R46DRAFT_1194123 [Mycena filopes]|nr:hypothetical protein C8R46DRAFT_1194123 [Mycena filopes]
MNPGTYFNLWTLESIRLGTHEVAIGAQSHHFEFLPTCKLSGPLLLNIHSSPHRVNVARCSNTGWTDRWFDSSRGDSHGLFGFFRPTDSLHPRTLSADRPRTAPTARVTGCCSPELLPISSYRTPSSASQLRVAGGGTGSSPGGEIRRPNARKDLGCSFRGHPSRLVPPLVKSTESNFHLNAGSGRCNSQRQYWTWTSGKRVVRRAMPGPKERVPFDSGVTILAIPDDRQGEATICGGIGGDSEDKGRWQAQWNEVAVVGTRKRIIGMLLALGRRDTRHRSGAARTTRGLPWSTAFFFCKKENRLTAIGPLPESNGMSAGNVWDGLKRSVARQEAARCYEKGGISGRDSRRCVKWVIAAPGKCDTGETKPTHAAQAFQLRHNIAKLVSDLYTITKDAERGSKALEQIHSARNCSDYSRSTPGAVEAGLSGVEILCEEQLGLQRCLSIFHFVYFQKWGVSSPRFIEESPGERIEFESRGGTADGNYQAIVWINWSTIEGVLNSGVIAGSPSQKIGLKVDLRRGRWEQNRVTLKFHVLSSWNTVRGTQLVLWNARVN